MKNLFDIPEKAATEENVDRLLQAGPVTVERIVSTGQTSPPGIWYDQTWDEWVAVLQGAALLAFDDGSSVHLDAGDFLLLPAHRRHRVTFTSAFPPCVWLAVHVGRKD
ncbi:MAG TPA: cupin domain-containing protein [Anaerolineae bacterium]